MLEGFLVALFPIVVIIVVGIYYFIYRPYVKNKYLKELYIMILKMGSIKSLLNESKFELYYNYTLEKNLVNVVSNDGTYIRLYVTVSLNGAAILNFNIKHTLDNREILDLVSIKQDDISVRQLKMVIDMIVDKYNHLFYK